MLGSLPARVLRYVSESLRALARCFTPLGKWDYTGFNPKTKIIVIEMKKKETTIEGKNEIVLDMRKKTGMCLDKFFSEFINVFPFLLALVERYGIIIVTINSKEENK